MPGWWPTAVYFFFFSELKKLYQASSFTLVKIIIFAPVNKMFEVEYLTLTHSKLLEKMLAVLKIINR